MKYKVLMLIAGAVLLTSGVAIAGWGPKLIPLYGQSEIANAEALNDAAMTIWIGISFFRLFGAAVAGFGILSLFTCNNSNIEARKSISRGLFAALVVILVLAIVQQIAIWSTPFGLITAAFFFLVALGYGYIGVAKHDAG